MLKLERKESKRKWRVVAIASIILLVIGAGAYVSVLYFAPAFATALVTRPIEVRALPAPDKDNDRIIVPKIGVNLSYTQGANAMDNGAEWRTPTSGTPEDGNFVIAAPHFSLQLTPLATIEKSPFYNLNKLANGDKIIIDFDGKRYGYEVVGSFMTHRADERLTRRMNEPTLTLLGIRNDEDRVFAVQAKRLGEVAFN